MKPIRLSRGHIEMIVAATIFGVGAGLLIKSVSREVPIILMYCVGTLIGFLATLASCALPSRRSLLAPPTDAYDRRLLLMGGIFLSLGGWLMIAAIQMTLVAKAVIVRSLAPVVIVFVAAKLLLREQPTRADRFAAMLGFVGLAVILAPGASDTKLDLGVGVALLSMFFAVLNMVNKRKLAGRRVPPETQALYQNFLSVLMVLPFAVVALLDAPTISQRDWCIMILNGALTRGLGHVLWYRGNQDPVVTTADTGIISFIEPLTAAFLATLVLGEAWTLSLLIGALCIISSCLIPILRPPRPY